MESIEIPGKWAGETNEMIASVTDGMFAPRSVEVVITGTRSDPGASIYITLDDARKLHAWLGSVLVSE